MKKNTTLALDAAKKKRQHANAPLFIQVTGSQLSLPDWCLQTVAMRKLACADRAKSLCHWSLLPLLTINILPG